MDPVRITLPKDIPNCPFTQDPVIDAIMGVCQHFFEKSEFQQYIERGGRNCPLCTGKIEWYAEVPDLGKKLGTEVEVQPIKLEGEHRIELHEETTSLEEGVVWNLILIERAVSTSSPFVDWCSERDRSAIEGLQRQHNFNSTATDSQVAALQTHRALAAKLYASFEYEDCETIQQFVNKLLRNELNFYLFNLLLKETSTHKFFESAKRVMGGEGKQKPLDAEKLVDDAKFGKKLRTVIGLVVTVAFMIGIGRKTFQLYSFVKNTNIFVKN